MQDDSIFLLNFCFDTKILEWISSTHLRKLFILNLLHHRGKCNLYLKIWERVSLPSQNQLVNSDRNLYQRNNKISGKSSLVTVCFEHKCFKQCNQSSLRMTQPSLRSMTSVIIIDKYILVLGWVYNLLQQERKTFLKIKLFQFCLHVLWIIYTCAVPKDMLQKAPKLGSL